ncbi:Cysteine-rich RLK 10 [Cinnamomum micranthum f. kanehirae]|uniref:Cysteine-rich RLK 10 n=1 Tax=Cinnamomum micranthum f. kanehirae TaxID=337451 RepID=A0A443PC15_9MAGN|nr:Cysteine-rich RLK 10 [Cinnamomum micranthum f. kanehirae]
MDLGAFQSSMMIPVISDLDTGKSHPYWTESGYMAPEYASAGIFSVKSDVLASVFFCWRFGLLCVQQDPTDRPSMSSVVTMLTSDATTLPEPMNVFGFFIRRTASESNRISDEDQICPANELTITDLEPR